MHPTLWAARNDKAWLQFRIGDIDGALTTIEPIVGTYSGTPWVANTYGVMLLNKGRYTEAVTSFEKGLATINKMTISDWGRAYPGNNPDIYEEGLEQTKDSMAKNLQLAKEKLMKLKKQETDTRTLYTAP
jgi:tetratricopeptide (TPR) repeat protein